MKLTIQSLKKISFDVEIDDAEITVLNLKTTLAEMNNAVPEQITLMFAGKQLKNNETLNSYGVKDGSKMVMVLRNKPVEAKPVPPPTQAITPTPTPSTNTENSDDAPPNLFELAAQLPSAQPTPFPALGGGINLPPGFMQMLMTDPSLQQLDADQPGAIQELLSNPAVQQQLMSALMDGGSGMSDGFNGPQIIQVDLTQAELDDIRQLEAFGASHSMAVQCYLLCDKDVQKAGNMVMDELMGGGIDSQMMSPIPQFSDDDSIDINETITGIASPIMQNNSVPNNSTNSEPTIIQPTVDSSASESTVTAPTDSSNTEPTNDALIGEPITDPIANPTDSSDAEPTNDSSIGGPTDEPIADSTDSSDAEPIADPTDSSDAEPIEEPTDSPSNVQPTNEPSDTETVSDTPNPEPTGFIPSSELVKLQQFQSVLNLLVDADSSSDKVKLVKLQLKQVLTMVDSFVEDCL
jgi:hypothetical protein